MLDIAKHLKISQSAVSLALRNSPEVSPALCKRVQKSAEKMGYRPDPMLASLIQYRHDKRSHPIAAELAWINCWPNPKQLHSFRELDLYWQGATAEAERAGYRLEEFVVNAQLSPARLQQILTTRAIRGILIPPHSTNPDWKGFQWDHFCVIRFGLSLPTPKTHVITSDQYANAELAYLNIINLGYRCPGYVGNQGDPVYWRFALGFLAREFRRDPTNVVPTLFLNKANRAESLKQLSIWIKKHRIDAIFSPASGMQQLLTDLGYRVPDDIGLATTSILDGNADTGINQNSEEIGKAAIQLLISLINHSEYGIPAVCREVLVEGTWVNGSTLPMKVS